jgi:hypothetical protein
LELESQIKALRAVGKITMEPLKQWKCDVCGGIIDDAEHAYLEWMYFDETDQEGNFRIVHNKLECRYRMNEAQYLSAGIIIKDWILADYVGPNGLMELVELLYERNLKDKTEIYELIRRLHIPFYEQAREYYEIAEEDGRFDGTGDQNAYRYYQRVILDIISRYA